MPARVLHARDADSRPSNQMGVLNTDLGKQLDGDPFAARHTLEMTAEQLAQLYPDGPRALPPELAG